MLKMANKASLLL